MLKILALTSLIISPPSVAQQCEDIAWQNSAVLTAALREVEELGDVKYLMIDPGKEMVRFVLEGETKNKFVTYVTCGREEIIFSKVQSF